MSNHSEIKFILGPCQIEVGNMHLIFVMKYIDYQRDLILVSFLKVHMTRLIEPVLRAKEVSELKRFRHFI